MRFVRLIMASMLVAGMSLTTKPTVAAQIAGVPAAVPPGLDRRLEIFFGNDFFGAGDYEDDFRTQQLGLTAALGERWLFVIDHSILTLEEPEQGPPGRLDQLSASLGYRAFEDTSGRVRQSLDIGAGLRISDDLAGSRIQNGFHQILSNSIKTMPYVDTERTDGMFWLAYDHDGRFTDDLRIPLLGDQWQAGYWLRGATLVTTDGQWDGDVRLAAVIGKRWWQGWFGVSGNWREGYDRDNVQRETARSESGTGLVIGLRLGPLLLETEQRFGDDTSYGHISFVSTGEPLQWSGSGDHQFSVQTGLTVPDVLVTLQGRWTSCQWMPCGDTWRSAVVVDTRFGSPQFGSATDQFVDTVQIGAAWEFEALPAPSVEWLSAFVSAGAGWRSETLTGDGALGGQESDTAERAGLTADAGLRFSTMAQNQRWRFRLQVGLSGWLPTIE